jgi:hypothetical protein
MVCGHIAADAAWQGMIKMPPEICLIFGLNYLTGHID